MIHNVLHHILLKGTGLIAVLASVTVPAGAQPAPGQGAAATQAQQKYTLNVTSKDGFVDVALKAEAARVSDIATDLSKRLGARLTLGPGLRQETITVNIPQSALEPALARLAPRVFVDYEVRQDGGPVPREIYLLGPDDAAPSMSTATRGTSHGVLISGHTEETPASPEQDPLKVSGDKQGLMITARKQPLSLVAMALADTLGVPLELKYEAAEPVEIDVAYYAPPEDVIPRLSPNIRLHVRVDVISQQRSPLKLVLERASTAK